MQTDAQLERIGRSVRQAWCGAGRGTYGDRTMCVYRCGDGVGYIIGRTTEEAPNADRDADEAEETIPEAETAGV